MEDYHLRLLRIHTKVKIRPVWVDEPETEEEFKESLSAVQLSLKMADAKGPRLKAIDENGRLNLTIMASTPDIDSQNEIVRVEAFRSSFDEYNENPMLLAYHDMKQPVGKAPSEILPNGLIQRGFVSGARPDVQTLVLDDVLSFASIGFIPTKMDWDDDLDVLLHLDLKHIETSLVPIPANMNTWVTVDDVRKWRDVSRAKAAPETPAERPEPEPAEVEPPASDPDDDTADAEILAGIESSICRIGSALAGAVEIAVSE